MESQVASRAGSAAAAQALKLSPAPRRILVKETNWLGDIVMSLPALRAIRRAWPDAHLAILIRQELSSFFDGAGWLDEVIPYSVGRGLGGLGDRSRIVGAIRAREFDLAVLFPTSFESALWTAAARIPRRAGFAGEARGPMLTLRASPPPEAITGHQVQWWLSMVRATLGIEGDAGDFAIEAHAPHVAKMRGWLDARRRRPGRPLIAVAPAAAFGPAKEWPAHSYAAMIDLLAERHGAECVLVGAPGERAKCDQIAGLARAGAIVAAGETSIGELVATLAIADAFVGNDSGCMHVAGALGRPAVAIFGSTNPLRTAPLGARTCVIWLRLPCSPCLERTCRFGHYECLTRIEPGDPADALGELGALG
ncbi:MAG TPA: lipopolysaccharide heptosyltransferase II [Candidatus Binataceae bacterium]|nr:lipopolysaccharide heptosyltransferase II [Candidatus Binataceae bacterium]